VAVHKREVMALVVNQVEGIAARTTSQAFSEVGVVVPYLDHHFSFYPHPF
jgi:hypothetical protein